MTGPAPLLSIPQAPVPEGGAAEWVEGAGGVRLRAAWFPVEGARGTVVLSPGRTEPIEKYYEVVDELRARRFCVLVHDWRGQGLSDRLARHRLRGHASPLSGYVEDFRRLLDAFEGRAPRPWLGLGHSMGGGLNLLSIAEGESRLAALVSTAPMLGLDMTGKPAGLARRLAWLFSRAGAGTAYAIGRGDPLGGRFENSILTHDHARWARTRAMLEAHPELQLGGVTWSWIDLAFALQARLAAASLSLPLAIIAAGEERLVDNRLARALVERSQQASYDEVAGAYHEILMEIDPVRARFWAVFDRMLSRTLPNA